MEERNGVGGVLLIGKWGLEAEDGIRKGTGKGIEEDGKSLQGVEGVSCWGRW